MLKCKDLDLDLDLKSQYLKLSTLKAAVTPLQISKTKVISSQENKRK